MDTIDSESKIYLNFEQKVNGQYSDATSLNHYLEERISPNEKTYIFLDEIQEVVGFEKVLNSLKVSHDVDLYITGSNSRLLSGELATYYEGIQDNFPKYVLSSDQLDFSQNGIIHKNLENWLLEE